MRTPGCWLGLCLGAVLFAAPGSAAAATATFTSPHSVQGQPPLFGAACPTVTTCFVVGGDGAATVLVSADGGHSWSTTSVPGVAYLYDVACITATTCAAVGAADGGSAAIALTRDGHTWSVVGSLPTAPTLTSVSCVVPSRCIAVGSTFGSGAWRAAVLVSADGGATWGTATPPTHLGEPTSVSAVRCPSTQACYAAGGGVWASHDFGISWRDVSPPDGCTGTPGLCLPTWSDLTGLDFADATHGAVVGGEQCGGQGSVSCPSVFFSTDDGGTSWQMWPATNDARPFLGAVRCDGQHCLALSNSSGAGAVLATPDGATWTGVGTFPQVDLTAIACHVRGPCVIVGKEGSAGVLLVLGAGLAAAGGRGPSTSASAAQSQSGVATRPPNPAASAFSRSIPTPAAVASSFPALVVSALLVLGLVLLVVFPSQLFNRTYEENHERIRRWLELRAFGFRLAARRSPSRLRGAVDLAVAVVVGAVLGTLLDPAAGFNARSAALCLGIALSLLVSITSGALVSAAYRRLRGRDTRWEMRSLPSGLLVAAVCVAVSRAVDFQPGYLYGVIGGVAFAGALPAREDGHLVALSAVTTLVVAIAAWALWVPAESGAEAAGAGFAAALWADLLSALFVGGLAGVVLGLVPLRFLPGEKLAAWHWGAWAAMFALALFGLLQIMLRPQSARAHVASVPLWTTIGLFLAFGAASISFWAYFRATPSRHTAAGGGNAEGVAHPGHPVEKRDG